MPDGLSNEDAIGKIKKHLGVAPKNQFDAPAAGVGEAALSMVTGGLAQIPAGLAGLGSAVFNGAEKGGQTTRDVMEAMTYAPRTETGKRYTENVGEVLSKPIDWAGDAGEFLQGEEGRLAGRVATEAAMNFLPLGAVAKGIKGLRKATPEGIPAAERVAALQPEPAVAPVRNGIDRNVDPLGWENKQLAMREAIGQVTEQQVSGKPKWLDDMVASPDKETAAMGRRLAQKQADLYEHADQMTQEHPNQITQGPEGWKVDENNIPIREDLSIDAANAEAPLQRNLWGDELPRKHEQEAVPLTEAIDSMPDLPWRSERDVGIEMLANGPIKGGRYGSQRGAVDLANNASGESKASLEAQSRLRQEGELGRGRYVIKPNGEAVPLVGVDAVDYRPRQGEVVVQSNIGKTPWTVLDSNGVKNPQAMLARSSQRLSQRGSAPIINELADKLIKRMGGQVDSLTSKNLPLVESVPVKDSMATPTAPATIATKQELRTKINASQVLKDIAPEYSSITTPQEAIQLSKETKDINYNPVRDVTISGINGMTMLKRDNPVLNFARHSLQEYRNRSTKFSKDYITSNDGVATTYSKLKGPERVEAVEILREAAAARIEITPENIGKLGLKPAQEAYVLSVRKAMDAQWDMAADSLGEAGRAAFIKREGYLPNMFTGSYKSLIGTMKDGVFKTSEVAQADTRAGRNAVVKAALKNNPNAHVIELPRVGLKQIGRSSDLFNGFNDIMNTIAKHDPRFAELQMNAQMKINDANHRLMNFDVHEMVKKGVKGSVGDISTLSRKQNAEQLGKGIIDFLEQGADYYSSQKALNDIGEVLTSPDTAHLPNTRQVVAEHLKHVTGHDLNPIGNALNWTIDGMFKMLGVSPKVPLNGARGLKTAMGIHMMGLWNPTFTALQFTQVLTGALPEMLKVGGKLGGKADAMVSATTAGPILGVMKAAKQLGKPVPDFVPKHMQEAFQYAQDHGIMDFSELEIAHTATRSKAVNVAEKVGSLPISIGEKMTRPPVFMAFADIFHKFGLDNTEAFQAAQHATNMAMGDYHPAERPKIYAQLGVVGEFGGALTTFKHNALTQMYIRGQDVIAADKQGKRLVTPALAALATASLFQGISGMPGFDELDAVYQWATGMMGNKQGITETALKDAPDWSKYGYLSASSGLDFQSRASMARVLPEMKAGSLSPQMSVLGDIGLKAFTYGKYKDEQSFNELMRSITPSGLKGATEEALMVDDKGYVSNSKQELMPPEPRTDKERLIRKVFAIKPLRESVESKDVYIDMAGNRDKEEALKDISKRYTQAVAAKDFKGAAHLQEMWDKREGPPGGITSSESIANQLKRMNQSQRQRVTGEINSLKSINRYYDMND